MTYLPKVQTDIISGKEKNFENHVVKSIKQQNKDNQYGDTISLLSIK